jgi:hypothetical protein
MACNVYGMPPLFLAIAIATPSIPQNYRRLEAFMPFEQHWINTERFTRFFQREKIMRPLSLRLSALLPLGLTLLLTTTACTRTPDTTGINGTNSTPSAVDPNTPVPGEQVEDTEAIIALSGEGLQLVGDQTGSTTTLEFGAEMAFVESVITNLLGTPIGSNLNEECGAGPQMITQWPGGLVLHAANGEFIGWSARPGTDETFTTMAGVGIGSTRSELEAAYTVEVFESSLGTEFTAGNLAGILTSPAPDAMVENLWAGITCIFR